MVDFLSLIFYCRLPALRSIGLKCVEHLFFYKLIKDESNNLIDHGNEGEAGKSLDAFIQNILEED